MSSRDLEEILAERGVQIDHATLNRLVAKYSPLIAANARRRKAPADRSWRMDETCIRVKGEWVYLYRAVDKFGKTLDFLLSKRRNKPAATKVFARALEVNGLPPRSLSTAAGPTSKFATKPVADLAADLAGRPYEVAQAGGGWSLRMRAGYAPANRAAADVGGQGLDLPESDLAAIALHQPISRDGLMEIFGREISREVIGRLAERDLIGTGPRELRRGAPYTFVTTDAFLRASGMRSLRDLADLEQLEDAGLSTRPEDPSLRNAD